METVVVVLLITGYSLRENEDEWENKRVSIIDVDISRETNFT